MRRWFQFSLKSLLILMLAVGCFFAGWRFSRRQMERELEEARRQAVDEWRQQVTVIPELDLLVFSGPKNAVDEKILGLEKLFGKKPASSP